MQKHYLDAPHDIDSKDKKTLPDRSNLASLYPAAAGREMIKINEQAKPEDHLSEKSKLQLTAFVGILIPLPFLLAKSFVEASINYSQTADPLLLLNIIILTLVAWSISTVLLYLKIHKKFTAFGLDPIPFLVIHLSCLTLLAPSLYSITLFSQGIMQQILFDLEIIIVSLLLSASLFKLIFTISLSNKAKNLTVVILLLICLSLAIYYLISHS